MTCHQHRALNAIIDDLLNVLDMTDHERRQWARAALVCSMVCWKSVCVLGAHAWRRGGDLSLYVDAKPTKPKEQAPCYLIRKRRVA